jgi:hypothetical protein
MRVPRAVRNYYAPMDSALRLSPHQDQPPGLHTTRPAPQPSPGSRPTHGYHAHRANAPPSSGQYALYDTAYVGRQGAPPALTGDL